LILTDASALAALVDAREPDHAACVAALASETGPMLTTLPALSEAMFVLRRYGWSGAEPLWRMFRRADLALHYLDAALLERAAQLMERYRDVPMALADATLVAVAEALGEHRIFTLDADFRVYRTRTGQAFELVP
jgi:hypothetical protein